MFYLLGKIFVCLIVAALLGAAIGWFLRRYYSSGQIDQLTEQLETERIRRTQEHSKVEKSWKVRFASMNQKNHAIQGLLDTRSKQNEILAKSLKKHEQKKNSMVSELDDLREQYASLTNRTVVLEARNSELDKQLTENRATGERGGEVEEQLARIKTERDELRQQYRVLEESDSSQRRKLDSLKEELTRLGRENEQDKARIKDIVTENQVLSGRLREKGEASSAQENVIHELKTRLEQEQAASQALQKKLDKMGGKVAETASRSVKQTGSRNQELADKIETLEQEKTRLRLKLTMLQQSVPGQNKQATQGYSPALRRPGVDETVSRLETRVKELTADKLMLEKNLEIKTAEFGETLEVSEAELARYKDYLVDNEKKLTGEINRLIERLKEKETHLSKQQQKYKEDTAKLKTLSAQLQSLEAAEKSNRGKISDYEDKNRELQNQLQSVSGKLRRMEEKAVSQQAVSDGIKTLKNRIVWLEDEREQLLKAGKKYQSLKGQHRKNEQQLAELKQERDELEGRLKTQASTSDQREQQLQNELGKLRKIVEKKPEKAEFASHEKQKTQESQAEQKQRKEGNKEQQHSDELKEQPRDSDKGKQQTAQKKPLQTSNKAEPPRESRKKSAATVGEASVANASKKEVKKFSPESAKAEEPDKNSTQRAKSKLAQTQKKTKKSAKAKSENSPKQEGKVTITGAAEKADSKNSSAKAGATGKAANMATARKNALVASTSKKTKNTDKPADKSRHSYQALVDQHQHIEADRQPPRKKRKRVKSVSDGTSGKSRYPIEAIEGIGKVYGKKFRDSEVAWVDVLLEQGKDPAGREQLKKATEFSEKQLLTWIHHADLFRLEGVEGDYAELLVATGVRNVQELAEQKPGKLLTQLLDVNNQKRLAAQSPDKADVASWIKQAQQLESKISYASAAGKNAKETKSKPAKTNREPDDLKKIKGIGKVNEAILKEQGITTYAQIARLTSADEVKLGESLGSFSERVKSEGWIEQAIRLHKEKYGEDL